MKLLVIMCILKSLGVSRVDDKALQIWDWSHEYPNIPVEMVIAVGWHESRLQHRKYLKPNKTNDIGIMQINGIWENYCKRMLSSCRSTKTLRDNIRMGYHVLNLGAKKGDALKYYNYGNRKYKRSVFKIMLEIIQTKQVCENYWGNYNE